MALYEIGTTPINFGLNTYDGSVINDTSLISLSDYNDGAILLAFIDAETTNKWLNRLVSIKASLPAVHVIGVMFKHNGSDFQSILNGDVEDALSNASLVDANFDDIPLLIDSDGSWSQSYLDGILDNPDNAGFDLSLTTYDLWSYIISSDYKIADKWHTDCTTNSDPISFKWLKLKEGDEYITGISATDGAITSDPNATIDNAVAFDSANLFNTEAFITERITNLFATNPTILYTKPLENSSITTSNFNDYTTITIVFSKPLTDTAWLDGSYAPSGGIITTGTNDITVITTEEAKNKIENIAKISIAALNLIDSDGNVTVTLTGATDTAGNSFLNNDNIITFISNVVSPNIVSWSPANGQIDDNGEITVTFSENVTAANIKANYAIGYTGSGTVEIDPNTDITYDVASHTATITMHIDGTDGSGFTISGETDINDDTNDLDTTVTKNTSPSYLTPGGASVDSTHQIVLVLDYSGSMRTKVPIRVLASGYTADTYDPNNPSTYEINTDYSRTQIMENAVNSFITVMNTFETTNPAIVSSVSLIKYRSDVEDTIDDDSYSDVEVYLTTNPGGSTALGGGLYRAIVKLNENSSVNKSIILFTDGMQNKNPMIYKDPPYDQILETEDLFLQNITNAQAQNMPWKDGWGGNSNVAAEIPAPILIGDSANCPYSIFTIGVGAGSMFQMFLEGISNASSDYLCYGSGEKNFTFTPDQMWPDVNTAFLTFLQKIYSNCSPQIICTGEGHSITDAENTLEFALNKSAGKLVIHLSWIGNRPLRLKLIKDENEIIENVDYKVYNMFGIAIISFPNNQFPNDQSKEGIWKIEVETADTTKISGSIPYFITVLSDEEVIQPVVEPSEQNSLVEQEIEVGKDIPLNVSVTENGIHSNSIYSVEVVVVYPAIPLWKIAIKYRKLILSNHSKFYNEELYSLSNNWYDILIKENNILAEVTKKKTEKINLKPIIWKTNGKNIKKGYSDRFVSALMPGLYKIIYKIRGEGRESGIYERTIIRSVRVFIKPVKKYTKIYGWYNNKNSSFIINIKPKDRFGNLFTPGSAYRLKCIINDSKIIPVNNIQDCFDGSYRITISGVKKEELFRIKLKIESRGEVLFYDLLSRLRKPCPLLQMFGIYRKSIQTTNIITEVKNLEDYSHGLKNLPIQNI